MDDELSQQQVEVELIDYSLKARYVVMLVFGDRELVIDVASHSIVDGVSALRCKETLNGRDSFTQSRKLSSEESSLPSHLEASSLVLCNLHGLSIFRSQMAAG